MDERQQLLACGRNCASLLDDMERCEDEYAGLLEKESKFKKRIGWVVLGLVLCPPIALGSFVDLATNTVMAASERKMDLVGGIIMLALAAASVFALTNHFKRKARMPKVLSEHSMLCADPAISWLPNDYRNSTCARKILEYLANMRATTLQEAINLLETERHQATMEAIAAINAMNGARY